MSGEKLRHKLVAAQSLEEIVNGDPLVMPSSEAPCLLEGSPFVDRSIVELNEGEVKLRDDDVLVVARVTDQSGSSIVEWTAADGAQGTRRKRASR
jgi:hypothetical protein